MDDVSVEEALELCRKAKDKAVQNRASCLMIRSILYCAGYVESAKEASHEAGKWAALIRSKAPGSSFSKEAYELIKAADEAFYEAETHFKRRKR